MIWIAIGWALVVLLGAATVVAGVLVHRAEKRRRKVCGKIDVLCKRAEAAVGPISAPVRRGSAPRIRIVASRHN